MTELRMVAVYNPTLRNEVSPIMTNSIPFIGQFDHNIKPEQDRFITAHREYTDFSLNTDWASDTCSVGASCQICGKVTFNWISQLKAFLFWREYDWFTTGKCKYLFYRTDPFELPRLFNSIPTINLFSCRLHQESLLFFHVLWDIWNFLQ